MAWLTLTDESETSIDIKIQGDGASRTPVKIGGYSRAFNGALRSSVLAEKQEWSLETAPLAEDDAAGVEALLANGVTVTLSGDIVGESTYSVKGTITGTTYLIHQLGHKRVLSLLLQEV